MRTAPVIAIIVLSLGLSAPAHAYLDPGTGSILLQGLIAAIASVGFYAKTHWHAIKARFSGNNDSDEEASQAEIAEHPRD